MMDDIREVADIEISMQAFRLMRSGRYSRADELRKALAEDFPGVQTDRIETALRRLATKLHESRD